jgi:hypothetical protein
MKAGKNHFEFSCIPGFLITKIVIRWTKSEPELGCFLEVWN